MADLDAAVRLSAFEWLKEQQTIHGDILPRQILAEGFIFEGERIPLIAPQGIFKPRYLDIPLSITTAPNGPYADTFHPNERYLFYKYRGSDTSHRDNVGLRRAMTEGKPLVYFYGLSPGRYAITWPVYIVGDDPLSLTFKVAVDDVERIDTARPESPAGQVAEARRAYVTAVVRQRLHQRSFREIVRVLPVSMRESLPPDAVTSGRNSMNRVRRLTDVTGNAKEVSPHPGGSRRAVL
jgi:putative restriction endonuclease